jgi:hypothetical protein
MSDASSDSGSDDQGVQLRSASPISEIVDDLTTNDTSKALSSDDESAVKPNDVRVNKPEVVVKPRAYQLEMLEESLKRNIIIAV